MSKNILPTNGEWIPNVPLAPAVGSFHDLCEFAGWKDSRVRAYLEDPGTNPGKNSESQLFPVETTYLRTVNQYTCILRSQDVVYIYIYTFERNAPPTACLGGFCKAPETSQCMHQTWCFWAQFPDASILVSRVMFLPQGVLLTCWWWSDTWILRWAVAGFDHLLEMLWLVKFMIGAVDEKIPLNSWYGTFFILKQVFMTFLYLDRCSIFADK